MDRLQLIKPLEGQTNWGPAINSNFQQLYDGYRTMISQVQGMKERLEALDTLKIKQDNFILLDSDGIYIIPVSKWNDVPNTLEDLQNWISDKTQFNPQDSAYLGYDAWFVQTVNDTQPSYGGYTWDTGDLLIIHKQSTGTTNINQQVVTIEQWKNIMGGYFEPVAQTINSSGSTITTYNKKPSFSTTNTKSLPTPIIYWEPSKYQEDSVDPKKKQLVFSPKAINPNGSTQQLNMNPTAIDIAVLPAIAWTVNDTRYISPTANEVVIEDFFADENVLMENVEIVFSDSLSFINRLYFNYETFKQDDNSLKITIMRDRYRADFYIRICRYKNQEDVVREICREILNEYTNN